MHRIVNLEAVFDVTSDCRRQLDLLSHTMKQWNLVVMKPCANCCKDLTSLPNEGVIISDGGDDCRKMLQGIRTLENDRLEEDKQRVYDVPIHEALSTVFEAHLKLNQKQLFSDCQLRMCFLCLSSLISLNDAYSKFLKLTKEGSFVQQLLETSIMWSSDTTPQNCEFVQDQSFLPVEVKLETGDDESNLVTIKEEELDFSLDEYPAPRTSSGTNDVCPIDSTRATRIRRLKDIQRRYKRMRKTTTSSGIVAESRSTKVENKKVIKKYQYIAPGCTNSFSDKNLVRGQAKLNPGNETPEELEIRISPQSKVHHTEPTPSVKETVICPYKCETLFDSKTSVCRHIKPVRSEVSTFTCETCGKKFKRGVTYRRHLKFKHFEGLTADDLEGRTCKICDKIFLTKYDARTHHKAVHTDEKPFKCEVEGCDRNFATKNYLQKHHSMRHEPGNSYQCEKCGKSFTCKSSLQLHINVIHEGIRTAFCHLCGVSCSRQSDLNQHLKTHDKTREKSFECNICNRRFHSKTLLKNHNIKTHLGVRQNCTHCSDTFSDIGTLRRHLTAKHGIRPEKGPDSKGSHECKQCGKVFTLKDYLRQHLRSKTHGGKGHRAQKRKDSEGDDGIVGA